MPALPLGGLLLAIGVMLLAGLLCGCGTLDPIYGAPAPAACQIRTSVDGRQAQCMSREEWQDAVLKGEDRGLL